MPMNHRGSQSARVAESDPGVGIPLGHMASGVREASALPPDRDRRRHDTPLLPLAAYAAPSLQATLTLLTGSRAGHFVATGGTPVTLGRASDADLVIDDDAGVSRHHARIGRTANGVFFAEDLGSTNGTFVGSQRIGAATPLQAGELLQLGPNVRVRFAVVDSAEAALRKRLYESSMHDPLTHVFNRQYLNARLVAEISSARRSGGNVNVLMIDIDNMKAVNDLYGHLAGDRALCAIAARIQRMLRGEDVLARYGGDEFVVVSAGEAEDGWPLAERVRRAVDGLQMSARGRDVRITASVGVGSLSQIDATDDPVGALLFLADARMYEAKASRTGSVGRPRGSFGELHTRPMR
jgi:diguanylate cyclase (GGDEF)-like protein